LPGIYQKLTLYLPWEAGHRGEFAQNFLLQVYFTFVQSAAMVALLGLSSGVAIAFQANLGLSLVGTHEQLGHLLVAFIFREIAPFAARLILIARSITAIAADLATIKVQQEVEALEMMGISVYHYLIAPRLAACTVSLFCMAALFWGTALFGGWIGANIGAPYPFGPYLTSVAQAIRPIDLPFFVLKSAAIGFLIARIACARGLSLHNAPFEVPIVTNRAVVDALTATIGVQLALSAAQYMLLGGTFL